MSDKEDKASIEALRKTAVLQVYVSRDSEKGAWDGLVLFDGHGRTMKDPEPWMLGALFGARDVIQEALIRMQSAVMAKIVKAGEKAYDLEKTQLFKLHPLPPPKPKPPNGDAN